MVEVSTKRMARRGNTLSSLKSRDKKPNAYMLKFPGPEKGEWEKNQETQTVIHGLQI